MPQQLSSELSRFAVRNHVYISLR